MKKIIIIGSSGAGKSTFSRRLRDATGLPLVHLDKLYWQPNWTEPADKIAWRESLKEIFRADEWIVDGHFGSTIEMRLNFCDTAILLDFPNYVCVYRVLKRVIYYRKGKRSDMAEGCDEQFDWDFLKWIWNYPKHSKPTVENLLEKYAGQVNVIRLKSNRDVENFFAALKSN